MRTDRTTYADQLARTRALVQARQPLPADLGQWVLDRLGDQVHTDYLRLQRDACLRDAGAIIGGPLAGQVRGILSEAKVLDRCWSHYAQREPEPGTVRGAVHRAHLILSIPGRRRLYTILQRPVQSAL